MSEHENNKIFTDKTLGMLFLALAILGGSYLHSQAIAGQQQQSKMFNTSAERFVGVPPIYVNSAPPQTDVSVSATDSKKLRPDLLQIGMYVLTEAKNAKVAQEDNARVFSQLKSNLMSKGVKEADIQSTSYSIEPIYESRRNCANTGYKIQDDCTYESVLTGYRTRHEITVSSENLDNGGELIDASSSAGQNQTFVNGISFTLKPSTRSDAEQSLLKSASSQARARAEKIVDGLNVRLGKVKTASQSYSYSPGPYFAKTLSMSAVAYDSAPSTTLSAGQIEVSVSVSVSYEIAG